MSFNFSWSVFFFLSINALNLLVEKVRALCLFFSSPVLQALKDQVIKECVVGPRHVAFLLEVSHLLSINVLRYICTYRVKEHSESLIRYIFLVYRLWPFLRYHCLTVCQTNTSCHASFQ